MFWNDIKMRSSPFPQSKTIVKMQGHIFRPRANAGKTMFSVFSRFLGTFLCRVGVLRFRASTFKCADFVGSLPQTTLKCSDLMGSFSRPTLECWVFVCRFGEPTVECMLLSQNPKTQKLEKGTVFNPQNSKKEHFWTPNPKTSKLKLEKG